MSEVEPVDQETKVSRALTNEMLAKRLPSNSSELSAICSRDVAALRAGVE